MALESKLRCLVPVGVNAAGHTGRILSKVFPGFANEVLLSRECEVVRQPLEKGDA
jgi:hypothetical protein